ncbi:MAG TPA: M42 family metallopeptidase [Tissierellales bacterium]|nr:M42 family metallopeptidase [Tissierellales bacterium]
MNFNGQLLNDLTNVYSPSSNEDRIREFIENEIKDYVDEVEVDALGNLIARKKGNGKKIMLAAHMDQIGLMITAIDKKGFLRFTNVGGISPDISLSQKVVFENGTVGVIYTEPMEDSSRIELDKMYIDIGAFSKEEAEQKVKIGDICVYKSGYEENENVVFSQCLDDRVGCYVLIDTIKNVKKTNNDLYFVFSVQEEVGLRGAKTSAYRINPDMGIAIDVTGSGDTPKAKKFAISLDKGTAIKVKDNSILAHPKVRELMVEVAGEKDIPYQMEVLEFGGTDSGAIHLTREGIPSGVISIPTRYVHSTIEMASKNDIVNSIRLLTNLLEKEI